MLRSVATCTALFTAALLACTSSPPGASDAGIDAAAPQGIGAPCNPASANPCLPTGDPCLGVACDPVERVCAEFPTDAGPPCGGGHADCATSADCDEGLVCGFPATQGCSATGQCIDVAVLCQTDASACIASGLACACDGGTVTYVAPGFTSAPSLGKPPCLATDAGTVAADAGEQ